MAHGGYYLLYRVATRLGAVGEMLILMWSSAELAASSSASDPTSLIQFGVLGVIVMLILFGFLWAKPSVDQLKADKAKAEADRDALVNLYQTQVIPTLSELNRIVIPAIAQIQADLAKLSQQQQK